jgi:hypothetical protein
MTARGANGARATTPRSNPEVRLGLMATHPNFTRSFASVFLALAVLVLNPGPAAAAPLPAELTAGLDRTTAPGDRAAFTAALIEALGRSPGNARTIVIYAGGVAPAYTTAAASAAIQAFPGLRDEIMAGMAAVGPEHRETTRQLTQAPILTRGSLRAALGAGARTNDARASVTGFRNRSRDGLGPGTGLRRAQPARDLLPATDRHRVTRHRIFKHRARSGLQAGQQ